MGALEWTSIIIAAITAVVSIANGLGVAFVLSQIRTPSRTSIGKQVEDVNHTARSNWHTLQATANEIGVQRPHRAVEEKDQVDGLEDEEYDTPLEEE